MMSTVTTHLKGEMKEWGWAFVVAIIFFGSVSVWQEHDRAVAEETARQEAKAEMARREAEPASRWFEVKNISVPNFVSGDDPLMIYDRDIKEAFTADWKVEVHFSDRIDRSPECVGIGGARYEPNEKIPDEGVRLSWFMGSGCDVRKLPDGQLVLKVHYDLHIPGYPTKTVDYTTNLFRKLPVGSQLYITPTQSRALNEIQQ